MKGLLIATLSYEGAAWRSG